MEESIRTADAMFNIQLILEFCQEHVPIKTHHLSLNDLFYTRDALKINLLEFLAELFYYFEIQPISCVQTNQAIVTSQQGNFQEQQGNHLDPGPDGMYAYDIVSSKIK